jgi:hypothetical protein
MNPLKKRLAALRFRVRVLDGWLGVCALVALILGAFVAEGMLDFWMHLPSLVRGILLVGLLVSSGYIAYRFILRPFTRPADDLNLALRIEEAYPELNDALATTVQFLSQPKEEQERLGGSEAMRERTVQETIAKADKCDFGRILDRRGALLFGMAACSLLATAALIVWMHFTYSQIAFWRFVEPFGMHTWTQIKVVRHTPPRQNENEQWKPVESKAADKIAKGQKYTIKVSLEGQMPRKGEARVEIMGQIKSDQTKPLKIADDKLSATFETTIPLTDQEIKFKVIANDGTFPARAGTWQVVKVLPPPRLAEPPLIKVYPPAYADLKSPEILEPGTGLVKVLAGSTIVLRGRAERELEQAWIEYLPENDKLIDNTRLLAQLMFKETAGPLVDLTTLAGSQQVTGLFPAKFDADKQGFEITFQPWVTGKYVLHLLDPDDLNTKLTTDLTVLVDPLPDVKLLAPKATMTVLPGAVIPFKFLVLDDEFAIKSVYIEYRSKPTGAERFGEVKSVVLYDAGQYGKLLPNLLAKMGKSPLAGRAPLLIPFRGSDLRLRYKRLDIDSVWSLRGEFNKGDLVEVSVCAVDFCDVYPIREPGRSHSIELHISSKDGIIDPARVDLKDIRDEIRTLIKLEEKSLGTVKVTRKQEKFDPKVREHFIEAGENPQKEVVARTDTLRTKLKGIRETLQINKLTGEAAYQEANQIQGVLDSIAQTELPQITPKMDDVRNDLEKLEKNTPRTQKRLDETAKLQENVLKALRELLRAQEPKERMNDLINKAKQISEKERDLQQELKDMKALKEAYDEAKNLTQKEKDDFNKEHREKINAKRQEQIDLANQAERLIQDLRDAQKEFEKLNDRPNLDKVNDALRNAVPEEKPKLDPMPKEAEKDKTPLNAKMKQVAEQLKGNEIPNKAIQDQKNIVKNLDEIVKSLEGKSDTLTQQQIKEHKDAQAKVEELLKKNEELRKEIQKAKMIEDKEERLKAEQKIAEKMGDLEGKMQETRRELARLNEQRAADELDRAAKDIAEAKDKLENGGNPDPAQQKAKAELDRAKRDIQQAQDELARELLVKIADQLEGLKLRQFASVERSEALHAKIIERKAWIEPFLGTMEGNIEAQKGIGDETDTIKEKLKEAKVFHSLLEKAKKSMDQAVDKMSDRLTERKDNGPRFENGEKFDDPGLKQENLWQDDTIRHQKQAVKRLDILLDSIKEKIDDMQRKAEEDRAKNDDPPPKDGEEPKEAPKGKRPGDGLPPMAELKALRAEQADLNERFEDFAKKNDLTKPLDEDQKAALKLLADEQAEIHRLFVEITAQPEPPVDPAPNDKKEGDKK